MAPVVTVTLTAPAKPVPPVIAPPADTVPLKLPVTCPPLTFRLPEPLEIVTRPLPRLAEKSDDVRCSPVLSETKLKSPDRVWPPMLSDAPVADNSSTPGANCTPNVPVNPARL